MEKSVRPQIESHGSQVVKGLNDEMNSCGHCKIGQIILKMCWQLYAAMYCMLIFASIR